MLVLINGKERDIDLPSDIGSAINELHQELEDGDITSKGYDKKVSKLLEKYLVSSNASSGPDGSIVNSPSDEVKSVAEGLGQLNIYDDIQSQHQSSIYEGHNGDNSNKYEHDQSSNYVPLNPYPSHDIAPTHQLPSPPVNYQTGLHQTTYQLDIHKKPYYPTQARSHDTINKSNYNSINSQLNSSSNPDIKFSTMPKGSSDGLRFNKPASNNSGHYRTFSGQNDAGNRIGGRFPQQQSYKGYDEGSYHNRVPSVTYQDQSTDNYYSGVAAPRSLSERSETTYLNKELAKSNYSLEPNGQPLYQSYSNGGYDDYDKASIHSRKSGDVMRRRGSMDSSHLSIASKDGSNYYHQPVDTKPMASFPNIIGVLNHRSLNSPKSSAFTVVDSKGKDVTRLTWEKVHLLVDRYYQLLVTKKGTRYPAGSRVGLFFRKVEVTEFLAAVYGCFIAGLVAVPIVATETLTDLKFILTHSQSVAVLTTEANYKSVGKGASLDSWMGQLEWLRPTETLTSTFKKKKIVAFKDVEHQTDLAMLDYCKDLNGELKGVGISHRTLMAQCQSFREFLAIRTESDPNQTSLVQDNPNLPVQSRLNMGKTLMVGIEPRAHMGLLLAGFCAPFCGFHTVFLSSAIFDLPQGYLNCLSKFKANYSVVDYSGLKKTNLYHLGNPQRSPDPHLLKDLEMLIIDTLVPDPNMDKDTVNFFLKPFGCTNPWDTLSPMCSLPSFGGMIVSISEPNGNNPMSTDHDPRAIWLNRDSLLNDRIVRIDPSEVEEEAKKGYPDENVVRVISFGNLMPEVTVIIVNPDGNTICSPDMVGEIWVDSPALSGGYWAMPTLTQSQFRATAYFPDTFQPLEGEFLKTGLAGSLVDQQLVVFGWLDQVIRSIPTHPALPMNSDSELDEEDSVKATSHQNQVNHSMDLINTILTAVKHVDACTAFEVTSRGSPAGVVAIETKITNSDELTEMSATIRQILSNIHSLDAFMVLLAKVGTLPRVLRNGVEVISYYRTRNLLLTGDLPLLHTSVSCTNQVDDPTLYSFEDYHTDLGYQVAQHTGMELIPPAIDERFGSDLEGFKSITQLLQWRATAMGTDQAFSLVDSRGKDIKSINFAKLNTKALTLAHHLATKLPQPDASVLILMPPGVEYLTSVHGSLAADKIVLPYWDFESSRLSEEIPAFCRLINDFEIKAILVNSVTEDRLKSKSMQLLLKRVSNFTLPQLINVSKLPKVKSRLEGVYTGVNSSLVMTHFSPDMKRQCISFSPLSLLNQCKLHKYEMGLTASRPILTCARVYNGIGFIHTSMLGIYLGSPTLQLSQSDFATNPRVWFELLGSYGCSSAYVTMPMIKHAATAIPQSEFARIPLAKVKCLLMAMDSRPNETQLDLAYSLTLGSKLDSSALAQAYTTPFHSLISHRCHLNEPYLELNLHYPSLRLGKVRVQDESEPGIKLRDSGKVSRDTMVAIVNPVSGTVCQLNEVGEIWVTSQCNADGLFFPTTEYEAARFGAQIEGGDPSLFYVRTGDLGFLYPDMRHDPRPIQDIIATSPLLYVLGPMDHTFDTNQFSHFSSDIETSVELSHPQLGPNSCYLIPIEPTRPMLLCEIQPTQAGLSPEQCHKLTPLILSCALEQHGFELNGIVYFPPNTLIRSRLGDKARNMTKAAFLNGSITPIAIYQST